MCASTPVNAQLTTIPSLGQEISQGDIPSITYEQRGVAREAIRDIFLNRTGLASQIRDHVEDISLESINPAHVNTGGLGIITPDALITSITQSDASPTTRMDAIQAVLRRLASDSNTAMGSGMDTVSVTGNLALSPYNSVTDMVLYNPDTVPIPPSVNISYYNMFMGSLLWIITVQL